MDPSKLFKQLHAQAQAQTEVKQSVIHQQFVDKPIQEEQDELLRLQYDFEFVQHLLAPDYIKFLHKKGYFKSKEFMNYLTYLQYWRQPEFLKLLINPKCIDVLEMLLKEEVRNEIDTNEDFANYFSF